MKIHLLKLEKNRKFAVGMTAFIQSRTGSAGWKPEHPKDEPVFGTDIAIASKSRK